MKFFILNGHKYYPYAQGRLNQTLFDKIVEIVTPGNEVQTTIVEKGYDVNEEIEKYKWADTIIFQSPVNWFSVPWIFKKYFDEVYQHGVFYTGSAVYGEGGLLKGKKYMYSMTCNPTEEQFNDPNAFFDGKSPEDLIVALHKLQQYSGLEPIKSHFCFDVVHNPDIPRYLKSIENHIHTYIFNDRLA